MDGHPRQDSASPASNPPLALAPRNRRKMSTATSSPFLAPPHFSTQIPGRAITSAPGSGPVLRISCWRCFAAFRCDVSLLPARFPRRLTRRRNTLRDKALPLWRPPAVPHQVRRHPYHEPPKLESLYSQEPKYGRLDAEPSSDLKEKLEISGGLGASQSGNVAAESELGSEKDAIGVAEEITFCGTRAGPVFSVCDGPDGNVVRIEVDEDEMAMEPKHGERVAPKNSSLFQIVAVTQVESPVHNEEVSVAQRNATPLQRVAWSGFATLFCVCLMLALSKFFQTNSKAHSLRRLLYMHRPGMEWVEFDKGIMAMLNKAHGFPGGLQRRPLLDRKELMNNIKQAKESREWFVLRNSFRCKTVANGDDARITEIRRMVKEIHRPEEIILEQSGAEENSGVSFPHLIVADDEVSSIYGNEAYVNDVSDSSKSGFSLSCDKIGETIGQTVDMENIEAVMSTSVKDDDNIGEMVLHEPSYNNDRATGANCRTSCINTLEKEALIGFDNYHNLDPNMTNITSYELESEGAFSETCANNLDSIQGTKPSVPSITYHQVIHAKDDSHELSITVVPEKADGLPSDYFDHSASEVRNKNTPVEISGNDVGDIQEIEAPRTDHHIEFAHDMNIIGEEECKTPIVMDTVTATPSQGSREEPIDLKRGSMQLAQVPKPYISSWNDKQPSHVNETDHRERTVRNREIEYSGILDNASTSLLCAPPQKTVQHNFSKISTSEKKQEKRTSSKKKSRAHLSKNKVKLQKEVCSSKEAETKQPEQGLPGTKAVHGPSNCVQKKKKVAKKRIKKVQSDMRSVTTQDDQSNGMVDKKSSSQNIKKTRKRDLKNAFSNHEAQIRDVNPETTHGVNSPYNGPADNVESLGVSASSVQIQFSKDAFSTDQSNGSSVSKMRKQGLKLTIPNLEGEETTVEETENKMNIDRNETNMAVTAPKEVTKR